MCSDVRAPFRMVYIQRGLRLRMVLVLCNADNCGISVDGSKMKKFKSFPLVEILWADHEGDAGWSDEEPNDELYLCRTIGWLVKEARQHYFIYDTLTCDGGYGGESKILKKAVIGKPKILRKMY
jgi:hypothetical protein